MPNEFEKENPADEKPRVVCRLYNSRTGETEVYKEAVYTKLDGIYGYICVDGLTVKFFWNNEGQVCCDHLTYFTVHYTLC
jgi:hypothetical protein